MVWLGVHSHWRLFKLNLRGEGHGLSSRHGACSENHAQIPSIYGKSYNTSTGITGAAPGPAGQCRQPGELLKNDLTSKRGLEKRTAQRVKTLTANPEPEFTPGHPHGRKEQTPGSCPLTSIHVQCMHAGMHVRAHINNYMVKKCKPLTW